MSGDWLGEDTWDEEWSGFTEMEPSQNLTLALTCAARSLQRSAMLPYSPALTTTIRALQTIVYILVAVFGIFLNALMIVLVAKYRKLQTRSFVVALQIMVINLVLSSTVYLARPITSIANKWLFGEYMCMVQGYIFLSLLLLRGLLMFVFVIDRFLMVFWTYAYPKHSNKIMLVLSVMTWAFALAWRVLSFPGILDCYSYVATSYLCVHSSRCSSACASAGYTNLAIIYGPATLVPIILYSALYFKAWRIKRQEASLAASVVVPEEERRKNAAAIQKRERKSTITFLMLFISVFALTAPVFFLSITFAAITREIGPNPYLFVLRSFTSVLSSLLVVVDPIVIMRNKDVRETITQIKVEAWQRFFPSTPASQQAAAGTNMEATAQ